jgi:hypothetical protein
MEEATGAPSSFPDWDPKRLRASGRDGETVMTESPLPLTMLLSRHTKRREFITLLGSAAVAAHQNKHRPREVNISRRHDRDASALSRNLPSPFAGGISIAAPAYT